MEISLNTMTVALRVLTALTEKTNPDPADIAALEAIAGPRPEGLDLDAFACNVIKQALSHREEVRRASEAPLVFKASNEES
jgi:hypothetical protein